MNAGMSFQEIWGLGYYEAWRLWTILDEIKARDLQHLSLVIEMPSTVQEYKEKVIDWLESRQPRLKQKAVIPKEVLEKFAEAFNGR